MVLEAANWLLNPIIQLLSAITAKVKVEVEVVVLTVLLFRHLGVSLCLQALTWRDLHVKSHLLDVLEGGTIQAH